LAMSRLLWSSAPVGAGRCVCWGSNAGSSRSRRQGAEPAARRCNLLAQGAAFPCEASRLAASFACRCSWQSLAWRFNVLDLRLSWRQLNIAFNEAGRCRPWRTRAGSCFTRWVFDNGTCDRAWAFRVLESAADNPRRLAGGLNGVDNYPKKALARMPRFEIGKQNFSFGLCVCRRSAPTTQQRTEPNFFWKVDTTGEPPAEYRGGAAEPLCDRSAAAAM